MNQAIGYYFPICFIITILFSLNKKNERNKKSSGRIDHLSSTSNMVTMKQNTQLPQQVIFNKRPCSPEQQFPTTCTLEIFGKIFKNLLIENHTWYLAKKVRTYVEAFLCSVDSKLFKSNLNLHSLKMITHK